MALNQTQKAETTADRIARKIDAIGWGLFFMMLGGLWLTPEGTLPESTWLVGVGLIMLGGNIARMGYGLAPVGFTFVMGMVALVVGIGGLFAVALPVFPILVAVIGLAIVAGRLCGNGANASGTSA